MSTVQNLYSTDSSKIEEDLKKQISTILEYLRSEERKEEFFEKNKLSQDFLKNALKDREIVDMVFKELGVYLLSDRVFEKSLLAKGLNISKIRELREILESNSFYVIKYGRKYFGREEYLRFIEKGSYSSKDV
jgi:hypothetical protein